MPSITSWTRLEPRVRRSDPAVGLQARLHDPLWLLARQWQVGEFAGEDAGSPLQARVQVERAPLTRFRAGTVAPGSSAGMPYDPARMPLEVVVEREAPPMDLRLARDAGLHFLRLLEREGVGGLRSAFTTVFPLVAPAGPGLVGRDTLRLLRLAAGRVPDGVRLAVALRENPGTLPEQPPVDEAQRESVLAATSAFLSWFDARTGRAAAEEALPAWNPERMEYAFSVAAPAPDGEYVLGAAEFSSGHLDWHAFDLFPATSLGAAADAGSREVLVRSAIPAPVSYRGMPVTRWWEFEDGQVNFGAVDAGPADLLRLLLLGFALDYGNDWYMMPVELPAGAVYRVASLVVTDSFGVRTLIRPYTQTLSPGSRWRAFSLSQSGETGSVEADVLFLPPTLPQGLQGEAIEEVLLLRDEVANLGWAVERRITEAGGRPFDRFEQYQRGRAAESPPTPSTEPEPAAAGAEIRYRLANRVPEFWFPLVAVRPDPDAPDIRLARGRVLHDGAEAPAAPAPLGLLLEQGRPLRLFEEEVPRTGARVTRAYQYVRWTDGGAHLWIGRRKGVGRGEGSSGLRFDSLIGL
jgi:hypothetical protein